MDFKLGRLSLNSVAQGVGGLVFGNDNSTNEDSHVERLLDRISNGVLAEDRRVAMTELQSLVAESRSAQLAFGAMGFPILLAVLREEREDIELARGALETLVSALTPIDIAHVPKNEVQPAPMNSDQLSREPGSVSLLVGLLSEDDFYIRYYTLQLLTALLTHSPHRLQEEILSIPGGMTRLIDMLMDREVIRNEALLLLTHLTREAEEIQKIVAFEGGFQKIFSIIAEEGGSDGGVVVQDCLDLLNNLIRNNASNKILLKEDVGFEPLVSILRLRRGNAYNFTQQKTINLLSAMETVELLITGSLEGDSGKDANRLSTQTALVQRKILDHLFMFGVESQWAPISVRCLALRCIGDLVASNSQTLDSLANKLVGEEPLIEPALNAILRISLSTTIIQEYLSADYVLKCFCEKNAEGQSMLVSTMTAQPHTSSVTSQDDDSMSFGSMLLRAILSTEAGGDIEICCRAASILSHILKDNIQCKERVLRIQLEAAVPSLGSPEPLLHRLVKCLALAAPNKTKDKEQSNAAPSGDSYIQPTILRLLVAWLTDCPNAVQCFLDSAAHLTYILGLVLSPESSVFVRGLAAVVLGECVVYNKSNQNGRDAFAVVDEINQKIGLTSYFSNLDEFRTSIESLSSSSAPQNKPLTRSSTASMVDIEETESERISQGHENPIILSVFDPLFVSSLKRLEINIRESVVEAFSRTKNKVAVVPAELEQRNGEADGDYIKRLKSFLEKQCLEMQDVLGRNATLAEELVKTGGSAVSDPAQRPSSSRERVQSETLRRDLQEALLRVEMLKSEKAKIEAEASNYQNLAGKLDSDLKSLSDAYNSLEQDNFRLESEVKALRKGSNVQYPDVESIRAEAREEAQKESETELNDLLVCLGQEQSKVEKLSARLIELGEDVDELLDGIGDDIGLPDEDDDEDDVDDEN